MNAAPFRVRASSVVLAMGFLSLALGIVLARAMGALGRQGGQGGIVLAILVIAVPVVCAVCSMPLTVINILHRRSRQAVLELLATAVLVGVLLLVVPRP